MLHLHVLKAQLKKMWPKFFNDYVVNKRGRPPSGTWLRNHAKFKDMNDATKKMLILEVICGILQMPLKQKLIIA